MKPLFLILGLIPASNFAFTLEGIIFDPVFDGIENVAITLLSTNYGGFSNEDGIFELEVYLGLNKIEINHYYYPAKILEINITGDTILKIPLVRFDKIYLSDCCLLGFHNNNTCKGILYDGTFFGDCQFEAKVVKSIFDSNNAKVRIVENENSTFEIRTFEKSLIVSGLKRMCNWLRLEKEIILPEEDVDQFYARIFK